jgi:hypothetical protein
MILFDHLGPIPSRQLVLEVLLVARERTLLDNARIGGQVNPVEQTLDISDALFQLVHGGVVVFMFGRVDLLLLCWLRVFVAFVVFSFTGRRGIRRRSLLP